MSFVATTLTGKPLHVYVLIKHKSYPDRRVGWQALRGTFTFLEQKAREHNDWILLPAPTLGTFRDIARVGGRAHTHRRCGNS
ncbi:MAG: Rpn family recombination-promoting nuclease/putative transposase [Magnetococcales bacterium]|nr:Rpn family recombination-promoting nuclease/putative transposase [Magnetococcales bacterium]